MFCPKCGSENPAQAAACCACGVGLAGRCGNCGVELPVAARFCPGCGQSVKYAQATSEATASLPSEVAGERKLVTVLFADFAGYTAFTEKRDPEDVQDYLTRLWARLDAIIASHSGITEKHIGDALMAIFGSQQAREDDPVQAVRAALALQQCAANTRPSERSSPLQMRIGVHTGWVVLGPASARGERLATGDTVNLASRLEQNAPVGGVLISQDTYRLAYGHFDVQGLPPMQVRGKTEPVQTFLVLRARPRSLARTLRGIEGVETELVGREQELEQLRSTFHDVLEKRELRLVTVTGEAGLGKSRLLHEFRKWLEVVPEQVRFFYGRAMPEWEGLSFGLMRDVFAARFEILETDSAALAREKFGRGFADLLAQAGASSGAGALPTPEPGLIGQLLGFEVGSRAPDRDPLALAEQLRNQAFRDLASFFRVLSQEGGGGPNGAGRVVLLALEDIHWADGTSLDFLEYLAQACPDSPVMVLALARPELLERRPQWAQGQKGWRMLRLQPLSPRNSDLLVQSILRKAAELPPSLRDLMLSGAAGNPFYIEEIIKMLIEQKVIIPGPAQWRIEQQQRVSAVMPPTLTGVLQARLDGLEPLERAVLQRASVIGQVFWTSAVQLLSRAPEMAASGSGQTGRAPLDGIAEALEALCRKELILRRGSSAFAGTTEYGFKHELLRNAAYAGLLKKARRVYHGEVAAWLQEQSGERMAEFTAPIAGHLEQAERFAEAAEWYGRAGHQARAGYAPAIASSHFRKALDLLPGDSTPAADAHARRIEWYEGLSETLAAQARFAEAIENYQAMRALAEEAGALAAQARAWNGLAFLEERRGANRASLMAAQKAETLATQAGAECRGERIRALHLQGWAWYRLSDADAVLALGEQTRKLCEQFGARRELATSYKLHGVAHLLLAHFDEAENYFNKGLALSEELGDRRNAGAMWSNLGETARLRGDYSTAIGLYQKALSVAREIGHRESEMVYLGNLSGARLGLGQFREAEADLRQAIALAGTAQTYTLAEAYSFLSTACLGQGKTAEAVEAARRAVELAQQSENNLDLGGAWRALGRALGAAAGNSSCSEPGKLVAAPTSKPPGECFGESLRIFESIQARGEQARTLQAWAEFEMQQGHPEESRSKLEAAQALLSSAR